MIDAGESRPVSSTVGLISAFLLGAHAVLCFQGLGDFFATGHNGYNGAAFFHAARNSLAFLEPFPAKYFFEWHAPGLADLYNHHPLGHHWTNTISLAVFGNAEAALRVVPAAHNFLFAVVLLRITSRHWGPFVALTATALYILSPISAIYANMACHYQGFLLWSALLLHGFVKAGGRPTGRALGFMFFSTAVAMWWDWTSYYVAFCVGAAWLAQIIFDRQWRALRAWCGYVVFVLFIVFATASLVHWRFGSVEELFSTAGARGVADPLAFQRHLRIVPKLMLGGPVLVLAVAWLAAFAARKWRLRDLIPCAFLFAGFMHYSLFKSSALDHSYWAWPLVPGVSIAAAETLVYLATRISRGLSRMLVRTRKGAWLEGRMAVFLVVVASAMLVQAHTDTVRAGRQVGGSMWFVSKVRADEPAAYQSGRDLLALGTMLRRVLPQEAGFSHGSLAPQAKPERRLRITVGRPANGRGDAPNYQLTLCADSERRARQLGQSVTRFGPYCISPALPGPSQYTYANRRTLWSRLWKNEHDTPGRWIPVEESEPAR